MICIECRQRADQQQGCSIACSQGCDCQHRARRNLVVGKQGGDTEEDGGE